MKCKIVLSKNVTYANYAELYCKNVGLDQPIYVTDSQDLQPIIENFGALGVAYNLNDITGALVVIGNGDYLHIWITWSNQPYSHNARFQHIKLVLY